MRDKAFEILFQEHHRMITAYLFSLLSDEQNALDLTQETFLVAYRKMDDFDPRFAVGAWLRGIARNLARNAMRKEDTLRQLLMEGQEVEAVFSRFDGVATDRLWEERLVALNPCLERLPGRQREVLARFYEANESAKSIARLLGLAERSVFQLAWIARRNLRQCIEATTI